MIRFWIICFLLIWMLGSAPLVFAGVHLGLLGGGVLAKPMISSTPSMTTDTWNSKPSYGMGVSLESGTGDITIELDALYLNQKYVDAETSTNSMTQIGIQLPVLVRLHFARIFSVGIGGYYETYSGPVRSSAYGDMTYPNAGLKTSETGFVGSMRVSLIHFVLEGRYTYGLSNVLTDDFNSSLNMDTSEFRDIQMFNTSFQILLGYRFGIGR